MTEKQAVDAGTNTIDWYERRDELKPDMVFSDHDGHLVKLERRTPGDGTRWDVLTGCDGKWFDDGATIEPGDLKEHLRNL